MHTVDDAERGRRAFGERRWREAYERLSEADRQTTLAAADLDLLGTTAYLIGDDDASGELLARAHRAYLDSGQVERAARCAFWLGLRLSDAGQPARGKGWLARASRDIGARDCVERGYLRTPPALRLATGGDPASSYAEFDRIGRIARRFGDRDLATLATLGRGRATILLGDTDAGLSLLDEAMAATAAGEVSPVPAGIVYCAAIAACHHTSDLRRAAEWTAALTRWCESQPDLVPYRGQSLLHRAQIMQWRGVWSDAMADAERGGDRLAGRPQAGDAYYRQADIHRLRGDFTRAEAMYRRAARSSHPPQPGFALLRLAQGQTEHAVPAIRRAFGASIDAAGRLRLLPAYVDVMLAGGEVAAARAAVDELCAVAAEQTLTMWTAVTAHADGTVLLAERSPPRALDRLRRAAAAWQELDVPYEEARARVGIGLGCRAIGDEDAARMELDAARWTFERLGARPDVAAVTAIGAPEPG